MLFEPTKQSNQLQAPTNIIQQARLKGICYKCNEPLFTGHKQVWKFGTKTQPTSSPNQVEEKDDIMYVTEYDDFLGLTSLCNFLCLQWKELNKNITRLLSLLK